MIKVQHKIAAGAKLAPALLLILYFVVTFLDVYTTFLATPDLKYEGNWIIRKLDLGWWHLLTIDIIIFVFVVFFLVLSLDYLYNQYRESKHSKNLVLKILTSRGLLCATIIIGIFYSHIINLSLIVINNFLSHIYLNRSDHIFSKVAAEYINRQRIFLLLIQTIPIILGYFFSILRVRRVISKVQIR